MASGDQVILSLARSELLWRDYFRFTVKKQASAAIRRIAGASGDGTAQRAMSAAAPALAIA